MAQISATPQGRVAANSETDYSTEGAPGPSSAAAEGPGITDDLGLALDARNEMTLHRSA